MSGIIIFEVGSLIAALAPTSSAFIIGRAVSGLGFAGIGTGALMSVVFARTFLFQSNQIDAILVSFLTPYLFRNAQSSPVWLGQWKGLDSSWDLCLEVC